MVTPDPPSFRPVPVAGLCRHDPAAASLPSAHVRRRIRYVPQGTKRKMGTVMDATTLPNIKFTNLQKWVVDYYLQPATTKTINYSSNEDLKTKITAAAGDLPAAFFDGIAKLQDLAAFEDTRQRSKVKTTPAMQAAMQVRRLQLQQEWNDSLGPTPTLPSVTKDPLYKPPKDWNLKAANLRAATTRTSRASRTGCSQGLPVRPPPRSIWHCSPGKRSRVH